MHFTGPLVPARLYFAPFLKVATLQIEPRRKLSGFWTHCGVLKVRFEAEGDLLIPAPRWKLSPSSPGGAGSRRGLQRPHVRPPRSHLGLPSPEPRRSAPVLETPSLDLSPPPPPHSSFFFLNLHHIHIRHSRANTNPFFQRAHARARRSICM